MSAIDLNGWIDAFPLTRIRAEVIKRYGEDGMWRLGGRKINSAFDLAVVEQLRREIFAECDVESVPVDAFLFIAGEGSRNMTKIGGLPYRAREAQWPSVGDRPLTFVGQLRFTESADIVSVPGDLLLVFTSHSVPSTDELPSPVYLEWQNLNLAPSELIRRGETPPCSCKKMYW